MLSRRHLLRLAGATVMGLAVAGCGSTAARKPAGVSAAGGSSTDADPDDVKRVVTAISSEERLLNLCTSTQHWYGDVDGLLSAAELRQRAHVRRLRSALVGVHPPVTWSQPRLPAREALVAGALGAAMRQQRDSVWALARQAGSGALAELLASIAASQAAGATAADPQPLPAVPAAPSRVSPVSPLQPCLAAEHAAVWGYALLGGVLSAGYLDSSDGSAATASYAVHRARRDQLETLIASGGAEPVAAHAAYRLPFEVTDDATARRLARLLEARCGAVYAAAVAATSGPGRGLVGAALLDCAARGVSWGAEPAAFPGLAAG